MRWTYFSQLRKTFLPACSNAKIIKIKRVFPELGSQMYCHIFFDSQHLATKAVNTLTNDCNIYYVINLIVKVAQRDCQVRGLSRDDVMVRGRCWKLMCRRGVSGRMFLLVPAHVGRPGQRAVKRLCVCCLLYTSPSPRDS